MLKFVKNKRELVNYHTKFSFLSLFPSFTVLTVKYTLPHKTIANVLNNNVVLIVIINFLFTFIIQH